MIDTYFKPYPGYYFSDDDVRHDEGSYYWITGRADGMINVSGYQINTAEVESTLVLHDTVAEAAVVGCPHDAKGQAIYAFVTLVVDSQPSEALQRGLLALIGRETGSFTRPDHLQWVPNLPKTRSGRIMWYILRKVAYNELDGLGDTLTPAGPGVVQGLIGNHLNRRPAQPSRRPAARDGSSRSGAWVKLVSAPLQRAPPWKASVAISKARC